MHSYFLCSADLSRAIDSSVKEKINDLTGNDDYEFGDLRWVELWTTLNVITSPATFSIKMLLFSRWVDTKIKGEVNKFTNKEEYQFGDMTKEILRRVATGQYTLDDLFMLLKALAIFQASISPIGKFEIWRCWLLLSIFIWATTIFVF